MHIPFATEAEAQDAYMQLVQDKSIDMMKVHVDFAREAPAQQTRGPREQRDAGSENAPSATLHVGNIPFETSEARVAETFKQLPGFVEATIGAHTFLC